jgi:hypothetical protein
MDKLEFITKDALKYFKTLGADTKGTWGKMNAQQMIEHLTDMVRLSNGKDKKEIITPAEKLPAYRQFMMSEKEFRSGTKNPTLPEEPTPVRNEDIKSAVYELQNEIFDFLAYFRQNPQAITVHPVFGALTFGEWVHLHHKHFTHHLKQFNLIPS